MNNQIVIFNPDYHLKNDINRIILYSSQNKFNYSSPEWISFIHPVQAFILQSFNGGKKLNEVLLDLSIHLNTDIKKISLLLGPFINNKKSFYTEWNGNKVTFPAYTLITQEYLQRKFIKRVDPIIDLKCNQIDLSTQRIKKAPNSIILMLNNKCITNCKYCYADKNQKVEELTTEQILKIIDEAKRVQMSKINVIGGEIFLKKDWDIIIEYLVKKGLSPDYISTKVPLSESMVQKLQKTGYNNVVQISLDSMSPFSLQKILNSKNKYLEKIKKAILLLQKYKFKIQIDTILTTYNSTQEQITALYDYLQTISTLVHWEIRTPFKTLYNKEGFQEIKEKRQHLIELYSFIKENIIPHSTFPIYISNKPLFEQFNCESYKEELFNKERCGALYNRAFVLPDGKVTICEELYWIPQFIIGDLKKQTFEQIWNSPKAKNLFEPNNNLIRDESNCKKCPDFNFCIANHKRCWVKVIKAYGINNWDYPDPHCERAPLVDKDLIYT